MTDNTRTATYFLEHQPTTFDFVAWLCTVKTMGFDSVSFKEGAQFKQKQDYPDEVARRRLDTILKPLCKLACMPIVDGVGLYHQILGSAISHFNAPLVELHRCGWPVWLFPIRAMHDHITVTIRDSWRNKHRNSNRQAWDKFIAWAENNGNRVVVIEDSETDPMPLETRAEEYACRMNLGVPNGPMALCWNSYAPYITVGGSKMSEHELALMAKGHMVPPGTQYPWAAPLQRFVWEPDDFDVIVREFSEAMETA